MFDGVHTTAGQGDPTTLSITTTNSVPTVTFDNITTVVGGNASRVSVDPNPISVDIPMTDADLCTYDSDCASETSTSLSNLILLAHHNSHFPTQANPTTIPSNQDSNSTGSDSPPVDTITAHRLQHHVEPHMVGPSVNMTIPSPMHGTQSNSTVFTGSSLRPSSSRVYNTVAVAKTRSKTASTAPRTHPIENEGASSSRPNMRQGSKPGHILFDSDEDEAVDPPTGPARLNIGNNTRVGESEWQTVTKRRRRRSIQDVKIPSVQLHCSTGPHSKNIHILRAAAAMPGRASNVLGANGKPLSSKDIQSADFGNTDCTVCIMVRTKRQPIRKTRGLDRNTTGTTPPDGSAHYLSHCTHCRKAPSFFSDNMWSPLLLHRESDREPRIMSMVQQFVDDE